MNQDYNAQWEIWLNTNFDSGSGRARFALWEMRNLQIAANILNVVSCHSGERILVIIGSSHKGFLERYLKQMKDIELLEYE
jgi:pheromone shutdown protein TraB